MMDGFRVDHGTLAAHGEAIDALATRLRTAAAAGSPPGPGAYGVIGQVFATTAVDAAASTAQSVARLADGAGVLGEGVRATVREYQEAERRAVAPFRALDGGGEGTG